MAQSWDNFPPEYGFANQKDFAVMYSGKTSYKEFIERLAYTFDAYSFGRMMKTILAEIGGARTIRTSRSDLECLKQLYLFFNKMGDKNIETRDYDIFKFPEQYKYILQKYKVWCTDEGSASAPLIKIQSKLTKITDMSTQEMTSLKKVLNNCPDTKERNPVTKRCVNKCKIGYYRNDRFQCRKTKKVASPKKEKVCTDESKELNPKTKRCVKKCKDGFVRNPLFLCRRPPK
jgi:hypothetical protein